MRIGDLVRYMPTQSLYVVTYVDRNYGFFKLGGFPDNQVFIAGQKDIHRVGSLLG